MQKITPPKDFPYATPLLQPWGDDLAQSVARLIRYRPELASRMMLLPARGLHSTAVALHVANEANEPVESLAARISETHPRELLREAMPQASPDLYLLLGRATVPAWPFATYLTFEKLLRSRVAASLKEVCEISPKRIENAEVFLEADPLVWRARNALKYQSCRRHLTTVVGILRSMHLLRDLAELPEGAGRKAVFKRVRSDLARARAADQPFPDVLGWTKIQTVGDLWQIGERLKICVRPGHWGSADFPLDLVTGKQVFLHNQDSDLIAAVQHVVNDVWTVGQISGGKNVTPPKEICAAFAASLTLGGLHLVPSSPSDALQNVLQRNRDKTPDHGIFDDDDDHDDDGDEIDEVMAAAFRIGLAGSSQG